MTHQFVTSPFIRYQEQQRLSLDLNTYGKFSNEKQEYVYDYEEVMMLELVGEKGQLREWATQKCF